MQSYLGESISQHIAYDLRRDFYERIQSLSFTFHDQIETGQLMSRATVDVDPDGTIFALIRKVVGPKVPIGAELDLHCHLIPGIDDGPAALEDSLAMARRAEASSRGVSTSPLARKSPAKPRRRSTWAWL